jgi:release factor glutamine methyltransferase
VTSRERGDSRLSFRAGTTRRDALDALRRALEAAGIENAGLDARVLATHALGIDPVGLSAYPDTELGEEGARRLRAVGQRRLAREPVARIVGEREFWGLPFSLSPETLVPRPETETVVEAALRRRPEPTRRVLDLGTGSGCLLVALLHELPGATGVGLDRSERALATARRNARRNGVGDRACFVASHWGAALDGRFDLVVSNPPYIASKVIEGLAPEVRAHDPASALDGGADGLSAYRAILGEAAGLLAPAGLLVLEVGFDQGASVPSLAASAGFVVEAVTRDLGGHPRAVALKRPSLSATGS